MDDHIQGKERLSAFQLEFLANMSHELRSPLNSMLILSRLLADNHDGNLNPEQIEYAETVHTAGKELLDLIDEILDLAKVESGSISLRLMPVELEETILHIARSFQPLARREGIGFELHLDPDLPDYLYTDPQRLKQILRNLLSNAFKYTGEGAVWLEVRGAKPDPAWADPRITRALAISVVDTGGGVPADDLERVFRPFQRLARDEKRHAGSGLGLAISKSLAEVLGGALTLESPAVDGRGCRFTLLLPERPVDEHPKRKIVHTPFLSLDRLSGEVKPSTLNGETSEVDDEDGEPKPLVLVVEDDPQMNRFLQRTLRRHFRVATAFDGPQGLELARDLRPDLILTDVMMPGLAGDQMIERIRRERTLENVPVIILTAKTDDALRVRLLREGAQDFMIKPFVAEEVVARALNLVEAKLARESLERVNRELARTNAELEQFAYAASHDLAAPLRAIKNLANWIEEDLGTSVDDDVRGHFELLRSRADRMSVLLKDLLDYSRIGRIEANSEDVDLTELLDEIVLLNPPDHICVRYERELPVLRAPRIRLQQVFTNLVSNAIKHADEETSYVEIAVEDDGDRFIFTVADDGPGIPERYREDVFRMFKTLRPRDEVEGSGMGLAIVKKTVESFGGRIFIAPDDGPRGTTFRIEWPKSEQSHTLVSPHLDRLRRHGHARDQRADDRL